MAVSTMEQRIPQYTGAQQAVRAELQAKITVETNKKRIAAYHEELFKMELAAVGLWW